MYAFALASCSSHNSWSSSFVNALPNFASIFLAVWAISTALGAITSRWEFAVFALASNSSIYGLSFSISALSSAVFLLVTSIFLPLALIASKISSIGFNLSRILSIYAFQVGTKSLKSSKPSLIALTTASISAAILSAASAMLILLDSDASWIAAIIPSALNNLSPYLLRYISMLSLLLRIFLISARSSSLFATLCIFSWVPKSLNISCNLS